MTERGHNPNLDRLLQTSAMRWRADAPTDRSPLCPQSARKWTKRWLPGSAKSRHTMTTMVE